MSDQGDSWPRLAFWQPPLNLGGVLPYHLPNLESGRHSLL